MHELTDEELNLVLTNIFIRLEKIEAKLRRAAGLDEQAKRDAETVAAWFDERLGVPHEERPDQWASNN